MATSEWSAYASARSLGAGDAGEVIQFANLSLTPGAWSELTASRGKRYDDDRAPVIDVTNVWDKTWRTREDRTAAARLQRELRDVLDAVMGRDPGPVERFMNAGGPFRCHVEGTTARPSKAAGAAGTSDRESESWRLRWVPARASGARAALVHYMRDVLHYADRLGRCEQCGAFFLRDARWANRVRRFCSERCSIDFHNAKRLGPGGYFTKRRRTKHRRQD